VLDAVLFTRPEIERPTALQVVLDN